MEGRKQGATADRESQDVFFIWVTGFPRKYTPSPVVRSHTLLTWPAPRSDPERLPAWPTHPRKGSPGRAHQGIPACLYSFGWTEGVNLCLWLSALSSVRCDRRACWGSGDAARVPIAAALRGLAQGQGQHLAVTITFSVETKPS